MHRNWLLPAVTLLPAFIGGLLLIWRPRSRMMRLAVVGGTLAVTLLAVIWVAALPTLSVSLNPSGPAVLSFLLKTDEVARLFSVLTVSLWLLGGVYAFFYLKDDPRENRFYGVYLLVLGALLGLDFAGNLPTFYLFFEAVTLLSFPLVLHTGTPEARTAALKYLFYSLCGGFLALLGIAFFSLYLPSLTFTPGGVLSALPLAGRNGVLEALTFVCLLGFSVKAGLFPLHNWLPAAHAVAPAPASAVLSGVIAKAGVLGVLRVVYFVIGPDALTGSWVQTVFLGLTLATIVIGSMMAYQENGLKKRLAYSTVSQLSYSLFGLFLLTPGGLEGGLFHVVVHGLSKSALFFAAGAFALITGKTTVQDLRGIGCRHPATLLGYTLASLCLIGLPLTGGFVSKWQLATASLAAPLCGWSLAGPVVLLLSALLTAGYLLPPVVDGFFPGRDAPVLSRSSPSPVLSAVVLFLGILAVGLGLFSFIQIPFLSGWIGGLF